MRYVLALLGAVLFVGGLAWATVEITPGWTCPDVVAGKSVEIHSACTEPEGDGGGDDAPAECEITDWLFICFEPSPSEACNAQDPECIAPCAEYVGNGNCS